MKGDYIFQPDGPEVFLREALGRNAVYLKGPSERFRSAVSWQKVNQLLAFGGLAYPRLRVIDGNQELPPDAFSRTGRNGYPDLLVSELTALLRRGAVLAIDAIDRLDQEVSGTCRDVESVLGLPVDAELYASGADGMPRSPRWDDHETLLFQIDGSKTWSLYSPTADFPTQGMLLPEPQGTPRWTGVLGPGDLLYIPRGWWYLDHPSDEPSLYVAVSFAIPRGADIILRLADSLRAKEVARADIPLFRQAEHQARYITHMQHEVVKSITQPGMLTGVLDQIRDWAEPLVEFCLPWSADARPTPPSLVYRLVLLMRFPSSGLFARHRGDGWIDLPHNGHLVRFDEGVIALLERLARHPTPTVGELVSEYAPLMGEEVVVDHISDLIRSGLLSARPPCGDMGVSDQPLESDPTSGDEQCRSVVQ